MPSLPETSPRLPPRLHGLFVFLDFAFQAYQRDPANSAALKHSIRGLDAVRALSPQRNHDAVDLLVGALKRLWKSLQEGSQAADEPILNAIKAGYRSLRSCLESSEAVIPAKDARADMASQCPEPTATAKTNRSPKYWTQGACRPKGPLSRFFAAQTKSEPQ